MPSRELILAGLHFVANRALTVASVWHILALLALIGVASGWRPSRKTIALLLASPLLSVAVVAWIHRNPFNGATFTVLFVVLGLLGLRLPPAPLRRPPRSRLILGVGMVVFGLVYPHFLDSISPLWYLYAAPMGVLPCPTLSFAVGIALMVEGLGSLAWTLVLAGAGLGYGLFGVARLGVALDVGLVVGAAGLLARELATDRGGLRERSRRLG